MKSLVVFVLGMVFVVTAQAGSPSGEKPVQHLKVADLTSMEEAKSVFLDKTIEIATKQTLDSAELQQIHVITYTLEKSVAYFAEQLSGAPQVLAQEIAVVVENIHIHSENNRKADTQEQLRQYFEQAQNFIVQYW